MADQGDLRATRMSRSPARARPVIACIDDGPGGLTVARFAGSLVNRLGLRLVLATVEPAAATTPGDVHIGAAKLGRGRRMLARMAGVLDQPVELRVAFGEPAERLIALAQQESAELVVIGAPGEAPTRPSPLGSAYLALAGVGPCPVVLIPRDMHALPAAAGPIVCDVDGSPSSLVAARFAAELSRRLDVRLRLDNGTGTPTAAAHESVQLVVTGSHGRPDTSAPFLPASVIASLAATGSRPLVVVPSPATPRFVPERLVMAAHPHRSGAVLRVSGEIDLASAPEVEREAMLLGDRNGSLVLDLSETTFMDVAGLRAIERITRRAGELGGRLAVVTTTYAVRRILDLVPHPWLLESGDLDTALEVVHNRSPAP